MRLGSGRLLFRRVRTLFRDREFILRDERGSRRFIVRARAQWLGIGLVTGLAMWGLSTSVLLWQARVTVGDQASAIADLQAGYAGVISGMARESSGASSAVLRQVIRERETQALRDTIQALQSDLVQIQTRLADRERRLAAAEAASSAVGAQVAQLLDSLNDARADRDRLSRQVDSLESEIASLSTSRETLIAQRSALNGQLADLRSSIGEAGTGAGTLQAHVDRLTQAVDEAYDAVERVAAERDDMRRRLDESREALAAAGERIDGLEGRLAWANRQVAVLESDRSVLIDERGALRGRVERLEQDLQQTVEGHEALLARLRDETLVHVSSVEEGLARTGLDIEALIQTLRSEQDLSARGGPLIPVLPAGLLGPEAMNNAEAISRTVERAAELQTVVDSLPIWRPVPTSQTSSNFGVRRDPFTGRMARHEGIDFPAPTRTPVYAAGPGLVVHASRLGGYGNLVELDHGLGLTTRYAHLHTIEVEVGQQVSAGELVGLVGTTGRSTGPHLHYEVRLDGVPLNPAGFIGAGEDVLQVTAQAGSTARQVACGEGCTN